MRLVFAGCHSCLLTYTDDKEDVFISIRAVFNTVPHHTYRPTCLYTYTQIKNAWATCNTGLPKYYQLPNINKPGHKAVMSQLL